MNPKRNPSPPKYLFSPERLNLQQVAALHFATQRRDKRRILELMQLCADFDVYALPHSEEAQVIEDFAAALDDSGARLLRRG